MTRIYFLKTKLEVFEKFTEFYHLVQTQYNSKIQILRSDNGREYVNFRMTSFFTEKGLVHQTSCAYTPEQNRVAERKNRYILEITRALLIESSISKSFLPEAIATAVYLLNRLPTGILNFKTPLEVFSSQNSVSSLHLDPKIFGCTVFVHIPKHNRNKFSPCAVKCVFLGYGKNQKGYRCYNPLTDRMYTTMNCDFVESEYFYSQSNGQGERESENSSRDALNWLPLWGETIQGGEKNQTSQPCQILVTEVGPTEEVSNTTGQSNPQEQNVPPHDTAELSDQSLNPEVTTSDPDIDNSPETANSDRSNAEELVTEQDTGHDRLPHRSTRGIPPRRYSPDWKGRKSRYSVTNLTQGHLTEMARAFEAALYEEKEIPQSFEEAMKHKHWREAMKKEIDALIKNKTWEKCTLPPGNKPVGCRWIFTIKRRADGSIERYKARLVASL